ncbi:MAG: YfhO family protein [Limisphaerales bacterium]
MKFSLAKFAVLLGAVLLIRYGLVLAGIESFVLRDFNRFGYPLAAYVHDSFWDGEMPLWNPYNHCGLPFLAQWNTLACYPPSLIYCLFPVSWGLNVFCLLHLYAAGLGMFVLARRWIEDDTGAAVAGFAYAFSGILINSLMWPNNIAALGCLPWVIWATERGLEGERKWLATAMLLGALQMLSGAPEIIMCTWVIIVIVRVAKPVVSLKIDAGRLGLIIAGIAALAMVQLLPFFELLQYSSRDTGTVNDGWSVPAHFWANYLAPLFRVGERADGILFLEGQQWTHSHYAGVGVLLLAIYGTMLDKSRRTRALTILATVGMILALGNKGLLFKAFSSLGPIAMMRYPVKFLILPTILIPLLAGIGIRSLMTADKSLIVQRAKLLAAILVVAFVATAWMIAITKGTYGERPDLAWRSWVIALVVLAFVFVWIWRANFSAKSVGILLTILAADLVFHHPGLSPTVERTYWTFPVPVGLDGKAPRLAEGRVAITPGVQYTLIYRPTDDMVKNLIGSRASLPADLNLITRTPRVEGFYSMSFAEMFEVQKKLYTDVATLRKPVADFLGVRQYLVETNGFSWREHLTALPLVTAGQSPVFTAAIEIPTLMTAEDYDPRRFVFFDEGARAGVNASTNASAKVTELTIENHRVAFTVESDQPTIAVIAQAHYPAWKARVGEKEVPILKANGAFQALNIPADTHRVELVYRDRKFTIGLVISLVALLAVGWFGFGRRELTRK